MFKTIFKKNLKNYKTYLKKKSLKLQNNIKKKNNNNS